MAPSYNAPAMGQNPYAAQWRNTERTLELRYPESEPEDIEKLIEDEIIYNPASGDGSFKDTEDQRPVREIAIDPIGGVVGKGVFEIAANPVAIANVSKANWTIGPDTTPVGPFGPIVGVSSPMSAMPAPSVGDLIDIGGMIWGATSAVIGWWQGSAAVQMVVRNGAEIAIKAALHGSEEALELLAKQLSGTTVGNWRLEIMVAKKGDGQRVGPDTSGRPGSKGFLPDSWWGIPDWI